MNLSLFLHFTGVVFFALLIAHSSRATKDGEALDCPGNLEYLENGPGCGSPSCFIPEEMACDIRLTSAGCFCPKGMVVCGLKDRAICVETSACGTAACPLCQNGLKWSEEENGCIPE